MTTAATVTTKLNQSWRPLLQLEENLYEQQINGRLDIRKPLVINVSIKHWHKEGGHKPNKVFIHIVFHHRTCDLENTLQQKFAFQSLASMEVGF